MRKIVAMAVICLTAASGLTSAYAAQLADDEAGLRIRLKNELRRADKPSAGAGRDIYAWVQGGLLDFNSGYYSNIVGSIHKGCGSCVRQCSAVAHCRW